MTTDSRGTIGDAGLSLSDALVIRDLADGDSVSEITQLLHAAYGPLARAGFRYLASHQDEATTLRRLSAGIPLIAELDGKIAGTLTLYRTNAKSPCDYYRRVRVFYLGQFAVRPKLQKSGIGSRLVAQAETRARQLGAQELALDTAEGAAHLVTWYERLGFRFVQHIAWEITNYRSVVMSKVL